MKKRISNFSTNFFDEKTMKKTNALLKNQVGKIKFHERDF
jgi:hypothetical protein